LVLPGQAASAAGPASLLSWALACALGLPLAWMFAALARRYAGAGGVATYVTAALGPAAGGVAGVAYFVAGSVGQTIVPLTGGYYVAHAFGLGHGWAYLIAGAILVAAVAANLAGLRMGARVQLTLAAAVVVTLVLTIAVAAPQIDSRNLTPFAPHGLIAIPAAMVPLFFAFAGWEAVAHLSGEFRNPTRDVPRAVGITVSLVTVLYLGIAAAVVLTGTYGNPHTDHVAIELLLQHTFGDGAAVLAAGIAVTISLGTTNAFIAGVSRLGYSLALDHWLPTPVGHVNSRSLPTGGVCAVAGIAVAGLGLAALLGWGTETLVIVPATLVIAVYLLAALAGVRLLRGGVGRVCAIIVIVITAAMAVSAIRFMLIPGIVAAGAWLAHRLLAKTHAPPGEDVDHSATRHCGQNYSERTNL
jgi:amino acid efflux transporter